MAPEQKLRFVGDFFVDSKTHSYLPEEASYEPIPTTILATMNLFFSHTTWPWHLLKIILHILVAFFMMLVCGRIIQNSPGIGEHLIAFEKLPKKFHFTLKPLTVSIFAACLFLLHPGNGYAVNSISELATILSTLFILVSFWGYTKSLQFKWGYPVCFVFYLFALFSHESSVFVLPLLILFHSLTFKSKTFPIKEWFLQLRFVFVPILILSTLYILIAAFSHKNFLNFHIRDSRIPFLISQPYLWLYYLVWFFVPGNYSIDHSGFALVSGLKDPRFYLGLLFLVAISVIIYFLRKEEGKHRYPIFLFGSLAFLSTISINSIFSKYQPLHEPNSYFANIWIASAFIYFCAYIFVHIQNLEFKINFRGRQKQISLPFAKKPKQLVLVFGLMATFSVSATITRNIAWLSEDNVWNTALASNYPGPRTTSYFVSVALKNHDVFNATRYSRMCLAQFSNNDLCHLDMFQTGLMSEQIDVAQKHIIKAYEINPGSTEVLEKLGNFQLHYAKTPEKAEKIFQFCNELSNFHFAPCVYGLALSQKQLKKLDAAVEALKIAHLLEPTNSAYRETLVDTLFEANKWGEASVLLGKELKANPKDVWLVYQYARVQREIKDPVRAIELYKNVTTLKPDSIGAWTALRDLSTEVNDSSLKNVAEQKIQELNRLPASK